MKIGYLIGALSAGGSERQLSELAIGMAQQGHDVAIVAYDGEGVFDDIVRKNGIRLDIMNCGSKIDKIRNIRKWIRDYQPDVMHGFMKRASSLAVLANLPFRRRPVITSDFSTASYAAYKPSLWGSIVLFHLADRVITETQMNRNSLIKLAPLLRKKIQIIRNGVNLQRFQCPKQKSSHNVCRLLCVGSVYRLKNPLNVVRAVNILKKNCSKPFFLNWAGRTGLGDQPSDEYIKAQKLIKELELQPFISFQGHTDNIISAYQNADVLVHVSLQDGIPNAVVEAMACGLPIIASKVSDLPLIIKEADNGWICNAHDPDNIAAAMKRMIEAGHERRQEMGIRSYKLAVNWFGLQRFIMEHEKLYSAVLSGKI